MLTPLRGESMVPNPSLVAVRALGIFVSISVDESEIIRAKSSEVLAEMSAD